MFESALQGKEKVLGPEHPPTLETIDNLGILYRNRDEAQEMKGHATRAREGAGLRAC